MKQPFLLLALLLLVGLSTATSLGSILKVKDALRRELKDKTLKAQGAGSAKAKKPKVDDRHAGCKGTGKCGPDGMCWLSKKQNVYGHKCTAGPDGNVCMWKVQKLSKSTTQARKGYACTVSIKSTQDVQKDKTFLDPKEIEDGRKKTQQAGSSEGKKLQRSGGSSSSSGSLQNYKPPKGDAPSNQPQKNDQQQQGKKGWLW